MTTVRVEAPARLHLGMLDVVGGASRRFGGLGVAVERPATVVEVTAAAELGAEGPDSERALAVAQRTREAVGLTGGAHVRVLEAIPPHVGLGSGTKLALAVTAALAALAGHELDPPALARAAGRGARSAVGLWTFALGGMVVEGGVRPGADRAAPLLARHAMPDEWRCVLVIPAGEPGLSGPAEDEAFAQLRPDAGRAALIAQLVAHLAAARPGRARRDRVRGGAHAAAAARRRVVRAGPGRRLPPARRGARRRRCCASARPVRDRARGARRSTGSSAASRPAASSPPRTRRARRRGARLELVSFDDRGARVDVR